MLILQRRWRRGLSDMRWSCFWGREGHLSPICLRIKSLCCPPIILLCHNFTTKTHRSQPSIRWARRARSTTVAASSAANAIDLKKINSRSPFCRCCSGFYRTSASEKEKKEKKERRREEKERREIEKKEGMPGAREDLWFDQAALVLPLGVLTPSHDTLSLYCKLYTTCCRCM